MDWGAFLGLFKVMALLPVVGLVLTYFFGDVNRKLGVRLYFGLWTVWVAVLFPRSDLGAVGWDGVAIAVAIPAIPLAVMAGQSWLVGTLRGHLRG